MISSSGYFDESVFGVLYSYKWKYDIDMAFSVFNYDYGKMDLCWIENDQILERTVSAQNDYLLALTGGRKLTDKLTAGLNFKVASSKIAEEASANAIALDTALTYKANEKYSAVFAAQNIGYGTQFIEKSEKLPTTLMVGLNYLRGIKSNYLMIGVYLPYVLEESRYTPEFGVELGRWPVSAYIGYKSNVDESTISYGFGLSLKQFEFRYSFTPAIWMDATHKISLSYKFDSTGDVRREILADNEFRQLEIESEKMLAGAKLKKEEEEQQLAAEIRRQEAADMQQQMNGKIENALNSGDFASNFYIDNIADMRDNKDADVVTAIDYKEFISNKYPAYSGKAEDKIPLVLEIKNIDISIDNNQYKNELTMNIYVKYENKLGKICSIVSFVEKNNFKIDDNNYVVDFAYLTKDAIGKFLKTDLKGRSIVYKEYSQQIVPKEEPQMNHVSQGYSKKDSAHNGGRVGLGVGLPYGGVGMNLEVPLSDHPALMFGMGEYAIRIVELTAGLRLYASDKKSAIRPYASLYYSMMYEIGYYSYLHGTASGLGVRFNTGEVSIDFEVINIFDDDLLYYSAYTSGHDAFVSLGFGWHF